MERPQIIFFFEGVHDVAPCASGWHVLRTMNDDDVYFRRADPFHYVFGPEPNADHTKLVQCAPNEGPWLCEACGAFVVTESCRLADVSSRE